MEQNTTSKISKNNTKKNESTAIRFDKEFMKKLKRIVDKANKKPMGKKVMPRHIVTILFELVEESLIEKVINLAQEQSLTINNKKDIFTKKNAAKLGMSKEELELKMMEVFESHLSQNTI